MNSNIKDNIERSESTRPVEQSGRHSEYEKTANHSENTTPKWVAVETPEVHESFGDKFFHVVDAVQEFAERHPVLTTILKTVDNCSRLILSDFSEGMLSKAKETLKEYPGIEYAVVDIQNIPYADQSFDVVIANMMLYHVPDIPRALSEVRRVLREGGSFCCATYGENGIMEYFAGLFQEYGVTEKTNHTFTLQNGKKQLQAYFDSVERYDYEDSLEVTDVNDLADYIFSLTGMSTLRALPRETIIKVLSASSVDGVLRVPKEYGLFLSH